MTSPNQVADVYVINTCTVTHVADRKSRHFLRLARRLNPKAVVIAAGCYVERAPEEVRKLGIDLLLGAGKTNIAETITTALKNGRSASGQMAAATGILRTRSLVKVQDGCDDFCAYCIVPLIRGRERSLPVERVLSEVKDRVKSGYREVVLTGTKIGAYRDRGTDLKGLLELVLGDTTIDRIRLSSLQPGEITPALLSLWQNPRLCRHFHLSLQSGSDEVLKRMGRRYSPKEYRKTVAAIREAVPGVSITTDVIVGFPGESDREFDDSHRFCEEMDFARIHVFPYSPRSGTRAADMPSQVLESIKRERKRKMLALARQSAERFKENSRGDSMVLWESKEEGLYSGLTDNYMRVYTRSDRLLVNQITAPAPHPDCSA